jgi:hypothetical protein
MGHGPGKKDSFFFPWYAATSFLESESESESEQASEPASERESE